MRDEPSPTERLLSAVTNKPVKSGRSSWLLRVARQQAEMGARALAMGRCNLGPVVAARANLARAEDAGAPASEVVKARREIDKLEATFTGVCIVPRPRGRGSR
jgi:hypothetical protein